MKIGEIRIFFTGDECNVFLFLNRADGYKGFVPDETYGHFEMEDSLFKVRMWLCLPDSVMTQGLALTFPWKMVSQF